MFSAFNTEDLFDDLDAEVVGFFHFIRGHVVR